VASYIIIWFKTPRMEFVDNNADNYPDSEDSDNKIADDIPDDVKYVKILTFGDSLTEGYYRFGFMFHPYSEQLGYCIDKMLSEELGLANRQSLIHQRGVSGEFTTDMIRRLHQLLETATSKGYPYKVVCILGGTNDLSDDSESGKDVFKRLKQLYDMVLSHGDCVLAAITIPESAFVDEDYCNKRTRINGYIKDFCAEHRDRAILIDLESHIRYFGADGTKNAEVWDDALHMTEAGYDEFGRLVFSCIKGKVAAIVQPTPDVA
jgi:lysophospholipase L1-like esterase